MCCGGIEQRRGVNRPVPEVSPGLKFETHLAVCVRRILTRKDQTNASIVYCAHFVYKGNTQKNRNWFDFSAYHAEYHVYSVFFCDTKYAHKTQTQTHIAGCDSAFRVSDTCLVGFSIL